MYTQLERNYNRLQLLVEKQLHNAIDKHQAKRVTTLRRMAQDLHDEKQFIIALARGTSMKA